jgi:hypothetical protein
MRQAVEARGSDSMMPVVMKIGGCDGVDARRGARGGLRHTALESSLDLVIRRDCHLGKKQSRPGVEGELTLPSFCDDLFAAALHRDGTCYRILLKGVFSNRIFGRNSYGSPAILLSVMGARLKPSNEQLEARRTIRAVY